MRYTFAWAPIVALALGLPAPAAAAPPPTDLSLSVNVKYEAERQGDGAPKLHFVYTFTNHSRRTIYFNEYDFTYSMRLRAAEPRSRFKIRRVDTHPLTHARRRPPRKVELRTIRPGAALAIRRWESVGGFFVDQPSHGGAAKGRYFTYTPKAPGTITLHYCYLPFGHGNAELRPQLPRDASFWSGPEVCAAPVSVELKRIGAAD